MEEIISLYQKLIEQLNEEHDHIALCFQDKPLVSYRGILEAEREKLEKILSTLN